MGFNHPIWLLFAVPAGLLWWLFRSRRKSLNVWRAALLVVLLMALADLSVRWPRPGGMIVVLADRSASLPDDARQLEEETIARLQRDRRSGQQLAVVAFGNRTVVELPPQEGAFNGFTHDVGSDQSRLADGIELAMSLIPPDHPARLLVLSDGQWTGRDPLEVSQRAALRDLPIDYRVLRRDAGQDLSIRSISAPPSVARGQSFLIHAWIESPVDQDVDYLLERSGTEIASGRKTLIQGINHIVFRDRLSQPGPASYRFTIDNGTDDPVPQNNRARFMVGNEGELPLLCLTRTPGGGLGRLLNEAGMKAEIRDPGSVEWALDNLSRYSGVVLENIAASDIGLRGMELMAAWVESTGRGLMVTGGKRSYGAGGYFKSPLERILPVSMELRREHRKLSLAVAVALDRSGSMGAPVAGGKTKMDLANIGTVQVLDLLSDMDEMGVLAVDSQAHTILDMKPVDQCRPRRNDILQIESMGGGIFIYEALLEASKMLVGARAGTRHIILFADAADSEEPGKYKELLEENRLANITVSVVALGTPADVDADLLRDIATRGEGEIYFTEDASDVPRLFAQDTFAVARSTFMEEPVGMEWTPLMSLVSGGRSFQQAPLLGGYNLCYIRNEAQMLAISTDEYTAPVAAGWQSGAGRVLCYMGEVDGAFTGAIGQWPEYGAFLAGMTRWAAGKHSNLPDGLLPVQEVVNGVCRIALHLDPDRQGELFSGEPTVKVLRGIPGQPPETAIHEMRWKSADLLELELPLGGEETVVATLMVDDFTPVVMPPVCLPYSPEFRPRNPESGLGELRRLAAIGNGQERIDVGKTWEALPAPWHKRALRPALLLLAAVVFLLEILERRVGLAPIRLPIRREKGETKAPRRRGKRKPDTDKPVSPAPQASSGDANPFKDAQQRARRRFKP